jgi:hypothetical protein
MKTSFALTYEIQSGQRYCYTMKEDVDFNGDGQKGNSLMYIPTQEEIGLMNWADGATSAVAFEKYIRGDKYLSSHRGEWSTRYAGIQPFDHQLDLHVAQDFIYDKAEGRKVQVTFDILNFANLLNPAWGAYYSGTYNLPVLAVTNIAADAEGNVTPTYKYNNPSFTPSDFSSRWRCQLGLRVTF